MNTPSVEDVSQVFTELLAQFKKKNADYGNSIFREPCLCGMEVEDAILCRASDKVERIHNLWTGGEAQVDESIDDTAGDLAVYMILFLAQRRKNKFKGNHPGLDALGQLENLDPPVKKEVNLDPPPHPHHHPLGL